MSDEGRRFFSQERELLEVYARYAASALDSATALLEAKERYSESSALLELARALAVAGTSGEVAARLADAVPAVVDCDRAGVYLWYPARGELVRRARTRREGSGVSLEQDEWSRAPVPGGPIERLLGAPNSDPIFVDADTGDPLLREEFVGIGAVATILVPIATPGSFLGSRRPPIYSTAFRGSPRRRPPRFRTGSSSTRSPTRHSTTSSPGSPTACSSWTSCRTRLPGRACARSS